LLRELLDDLDVGAWIDSMLTAQVM